jgi:murein DD-endopeptidase MepM/ murein hydrolase activator NlpD
MTRDRRRVVAPILAGVLGTLLTALGPAAPAPGMPAPRMPAPRVPAPRVPAPRVPAPRVPAPRVPAPGMPAPRAPALGAPALGVNVVPGPVRAPVGSAFRWPLDGVPRLVRRFDPPPQPWSPGHRGVDLAGAPAAVVRAAGTGVVYFAGLVAGRPVVSVSHSGGLRTTYEPVQAAVVAGDPVAAGDQLGVLRTGHPGCPVPACLHWGLRRGDEYLDPLALLGLGRVRLLPVGAGAGPAGGSGSQSRPASRAGRRRASWSYSPAWL